MYSGNITEKLVKVFKDTEEWYSTDPGLRKAVLCGRQNTRLYKEGNDPEIPVLGRLRDPAAREENADLQKILMGYPSRDPGEGRVMVTDRKTFETAMELIGKYPG